MADVLIYTLLAYPASHAWWTSVGIKQVLTLLMRITYPVSIELSSVFSVRLLSEYI